MSILVRSLARVLCATVALVVPGLAIAQAPATGERKLSVAVGPAFPLGAAAKAWSDALAAAPAGKIVAKIHPGASLAQRDPAREFGALRDGAADLAVGSALAWSTQLPALGVYATPWIAPTPEALNALAADVELAGELVRRAEAAGVVLLAIAPLGHRALATTAKPVRAPGDLAGLRVRVTGGRAIVDLFASLGALPSAMSFQQAQAALAAGAIDAQDGMATSFAAARLAATGYVQLLDWRAVGDAMLFAVRKTAWDGWSGEERRNALDTARAVAAAAGAQAREDEALAQLAAQGMAESKLTPAGIEAFREASRTFRTRWTDLVGPDLVMRAEAVVAAVPR
jgi:TRAP-type C4-dicarboxylate transport system substrate-binding protein